LACCFFKGYAYYKLASATTALELAQNFQQNFLAEKQGSEHQSPKTLAIVDTDAFTTFLTAMEALSLDLKTRLDAANDPALIKILSRARGQALAIEAFDEVGTGLKEPSVLDIGNFFEVFITLCNIDPASTLQPLMDDAWSAYNAMFVVRGVGPNTANLTGMAIYWPHQKTYQTKPDTYKEYTFDSSDYATLAAPNWLGFLRAYYGSNATAVQHRIATSVCLNNIENPGEPVNASTLLIDPNVVVDSVAATFTSEIAFETDQVTAYYAINVTHRIATNRRLQEMIGIQKHTESGRRLQIGSSSFSPNRMWHHSRRAQATGDYYYIYGGDFEVEYNLYNVQAVWDRRFYFLVTNNSQTYTTLYVTDKGNGQKSFPVCYFSPASSITPADLVDLLDVNDAMTTLGCVPGEVTFSTQSVSFTLYALNDFGTIRAVPPSARGQIAPITYIDLRTDQSFISGGIVGSFSQTIVAWSPTIDMSIMSVADDENLDIYGEETTAIVYVEAYNYEKLEYNNVTEQYSGLDSYYYEYDVSSAPVPSPIAAPAPASRPTFLKPVPKPIARPRPRPRPRQRPRRMWISVERPMMHRPIRKPVRGKPIRKPRRRMFIPVNRM
jgi:hypothetical protein